MKKILSISLLSLSCLGWVACKKSSNTTPTPVIPRGLYATINGAPWIGGTSSISSVTGGGTNYVEINGYDSTGKTIDLRINNFTTKGTYTIPQKNDSAYYSTDYGALMSPTAATAGTISIQIVNDTAVGGTFSFTAGGIVVTSGTFNVNF